MENQDRNGYNEEKKPKSDMSDKEKTDSSENNKDQDNLDSKEEPTEDTKMKHRTPLSSDNNYGNIGITGGVEDLDEKPNYYDTDEDEDE